MITVSHHLLVDASCAVSGYVEDLRADLVQDSARIALLCERYGVGGLRDLGSGVPAKMRFASVNSSINNIGGTISITDLPPLNRSEIYVNKMSQLDEIISLCALIHEEWLGVRTSTPEFFQAVREVAAPKGVRVCGRGSAVRKAAENGDIQLIDGIASLFPNKTSPMSVLIAVAEASDTMFRELTDSLSQSGIGICTGLIALRRSIFVKEALQAPHLEELADIIPHSRYLYEMRQATGYLAGKRALEKHSGMREPTNKERHLLEEGWDRLMKWIREASIGGVNFLPASKAPQLAVVPGYGLLEELALLADCGINPMNLIQIATIKTPDILGANCIPGMLSAMNCDSIPVTADSQTDSELKSVVTRDTFLSIKGKNLSN
ncbi:hypothetical protein [Alloscardovia macacae]|uniref:Uncharacterized protein n=1 Tax=Alloscardovia macacae TaxID=1160091 RepID=A0A261F3S2_9BIFI|nr:hypothetical protein [Alloscardovia macacae]OZG53725.1 hypothetical protein ALMA_1290 [Alloscardovia macacae]